MIGAVEFEVGTLSTLKRTQPELLYALLERVRDHCIAHAPEAERRELLSISSRLSSPDLDGIGRLVNDILWVNEQIVEEHGAAWRVNVAEAASFVSSNSPLWDAATDDGLVIHDEQQGALVAGTGELAPVLRPLKRALHGQESISIFDPYIARQIYEGSLPAISTLKVLSQFLRRPDLPTPVILLQSFWETSDPGGVQFHPMRMTNMLERFADDAKVRVSLEIKSHQQVDGTRKWHGRYMVLSGKWVIQTDTGCDFIVPNRNAMTRIQPNEFFRWDVGQFRPERLQQRFNSYPSIHPKMSASPRPAAETFVTPNA